MAKEMGILEKMKSVMTSPSKFFDGVKGEKFKPAFIYSVVVTLIGVVAATAVYTVLNPSALTAAAVAILLAGWLVTFVISYPVAAGLLHVFVKLLGGKGGYNQTYKSIVYSSTSWNLLGWIPFIGVVFSLYGMYLNVKGLSKLHGMSVGRALAAILIPAIIIVVAAAALAYVWLASFMGLAKA